MISRSERAGRFYDRGWTMERIAARLGVAISTARLDILASGRTPASRGKRIGRIERTARFDEILDGLLLGDGNLTIYRNGQSPFYCMSQASQRYGWLTQIRREFTACGAHVSIKKRRDRPNEHRLSTRCYFELLDAYLRWYEGQPKHVPQDVMLTPRALAYWFLGDGTLDRVDGTYLRVRLCTHGFTQIDVEFLAARLNNLFGWRPTVRMDQNRYPILNLNRKLESADFLQLVAPFTPRCFYYKLGPFAPKQQRQMRRDQRVSAVDPLYCPAIR